MKLSSKAEYACLAVIELATAGTNGGPKPTREIALAHGIPKQYLAQILFRLKKAGLVHCVRGTLGGYRLARPADQITVAEIIATIDGHRHPALRGKSTAARSLGELLIKARDAEHKVLATASVADLTDQLVPYDCGLDAKPSPAGSIAALAASGH
jgi:Rrf2 family transcriptional regulator, cysteine metabolism repressor